MIQRQRPPHEEELLGRYMFSPLQPAEADPAGQARLIELQFVVARTLFSLEHPISRNAAVA
jgi:hypothetical protein